ncbi:hypothetical protein N7470_010077 [Penicillium chermesinum]|nr:hypothetical protein N7470_010077 [Penicillium chermesinum]
MWSSSKPASRAPQGPGDTLELRGTPEARSYQAARRKPAVARLITSGTVITLGDWAIRSQAPTSRRDTGKVQRLDGRGLDPPAGAAGVGPVTVEPLERNSASPTSNLLWGSPLLSGGDAAPGPRDVGDTAWYRERLRADPVASLGSARPSQRAQRGGPPRAGGLRYVLIPGDNPAPAIGPIGRSAGGTDAQRRACEYITLAERSG